MNQPVSSGSIPAVLGMPDAPPDKDRYAVVTDRDLLIFLIISCVPWHSKERKAGYKTLFFYEKALDIYIAAMKRWQSPEPIMVDLRDVFKAERLFNSAVHDDC